MITIYHNPRCAKSRKGLTYLQGKVSDIRVVNYIAEGLTPSELKDIGLRLGVPLESLVRKQEAYYKTYLKGKNFSDEEWIAILSENPRLLKRPIVIAGYRAVLADPPELIDSIL